jgi:CRISPR/Cas system-associated exonuclease Cas4 (RecB family)
MPQGISRKDIMLINHQSVSRKKCYETCSQQYKFRYHLKIPRPGEEPFYFTYGTIVHRVAELYVQKKGEESVGDIAKDLLRGKYDLDDKGRKCPPIPEDYSKRFPKNLRALQKLTDQIGFDGIVEHPFEYDLDPPHDRKVVGFIDRLILKNDKAFIIDYKTTKRGKWRVNKKTVHLDLQLRMYSRVIQREFGIAPQNIKAALYYFEGEEIVACTYSETSLLAAEKELLDAYGMIEQADPDKVWGKVGWHCKNCDYNSLCTFYASSGYGNTPAWDGNMDNLEGGW